MSHCALHSLVPYGCAASEHCLDVTARPGLHCLDSDACKMLHL